MSVSWYEQLSVDAGGAYVLSSTRSGLWANEAGLLEAAGGRLTRAAIAGCQGCDETFWEGTYELTETQMTVRITRPVQRRETWQRLRVPGGRPLLWLCANAPAALPPNSRVRGVLRIANHGSQPAENVGVEAICSWSSQPLTLGRVGRIEAGQAAEVPYDLPGPPAGAAQVTIKWAAHCPAPDGLTLAISRRIAVRAATLDVSLAVHPPATVLPSERLPMWIVVNSRGAQPAEMLSPGQLSSTAVVVKAPEGITIAGAGGQWNPQQRTWTITWGAIAPIIASANVAVLQADLSADSALRVGTRLAGTAELIIPQGAADANTSDNFCAWELAVSDSHPTLELCIEPTRRIAPGAACSVRVTVANQSKNSIQVEQVAVDLPSWIDLSSLSDMSGWQVIPSERRVVRFGGTDIDPGGRADLRF
ncbi:MAG: hypothetical protein H5T86_16280, partial [Armatimonadetes bacterium]|nr:hypothetical protein [Armatimonadota bacterium]